MKFNHKRGRKMKYPQIENVRKGEVVFIPDHGDKLDKAIYRFLWKRRWIDEREYKTHDVIMEANLHDKDKAATRGNYLWHARSATEIQLWEEMAAIDSQMGGMFFTNKKFREYCYQKFSDAEIPRSREEFYKWDGKPFGRRGWDTTYPANHGMRKDVRDSIEGRVADGMEDAYEADQAEA